jgi:dienelactone hydrolase
VANRCVAAVVALLLAAPLACAGVGRIHGCRPTSSAGPGITIRLTDTPLIAHGKGSWCTVSYGAGTLVAGALRPPGSGPFKTVVYVPDAQGAEMPAIQGGVSEKMVLWAQQHLVQSGYLVLVGCYERNPSGMLLPVLDCPQAPDPNGSITQAQLQVQFADAIGVLVSMARALPDARPAAVAIVGLEQGGRSALRVASTRKDITAVVTDSGDISADQSLSVHAAVLALSGGADMDYDPGFEQRLKAAGVSLDSAFYPGAPAEVTMDPTAGPAAGRRVVDFLDHQFR